MAGGFLAALGGFGPGFSQGQQAYQQRQEMALRMQQLRAQMAEQERVRNAQTAIGLSLLQGGMLPQMAPQATPMMAGPQPPMPGMSSQPAQPGYAPPLPGAPQAARTPGSLSENQIIQRESGGRPFVGWGGTGKPPINLASAPLDAQGFPATPPRPGPQGPSTAGGLYGITKTNWDAVAPEIAKRIGRMPQFTNPGDQKLVYDYMRSRYGDKPWTMAGADGGTNQQPSTNRQQQLPAPQTPPPPQGYDLTQLARQIKNANPNIDGETLFLALDQYSGLMSKSSQQAWERFKFQADEEDKALERQLRGRQLDLEAQNIGEMTKYREATLGNRAATLDKPTPLTDTNGTTYLMYPPAAAGDAPRYTTMTGEPYTPTSAAKIGGAQSQLPQPLQYPEKWPGMPDKAPPGVREDVWDNALVFARTHQMPALGFQPGMRNQIIQAYPAALHALGIQPSQAPDIAAAYAGERHGEIVGGGRAAQIALGIEEANKAAPQVVQTSQGVPRTSFPTINSFTNWLQEKGGGANIVAFRAALNTYLNVYASVVSRTGRLTDAQQKHAYELLSTAMNEGQIERGIQQLNYEMELMKEAVPPAMGDIRSIGQPPAMQSPQTPAPAPGGVSQTAPQQKIIKLDADGNVVQ